MGKKKGGYLQYLEEDIDSRAFLLEAGQGKHADGNMFALLRCLETDERWKSIRPYVVTLKESEKDIREKLDFYGLSRTKTVVRGSGAYRKILATAKYLATDNSFPTYFIKRDEQVYLNTWHGTPLKRLGRADISNSTSIGNVQKNFLAADYLLLPDTFMKDIVMNDYMIGRMYGNSAVMCDYPRNDVLFDEEKRKELREIFGLTGKKVYAYMPTWRGTGRNADVRKQVDEAAAIISQIESSMGEDDELFVNFHFLIGDRLDYSGFRKARPFPAEYETYDFLCACDALITDYSSVMVDFAQTGREIILYMYDYDEYVRQRGFYFDIRTLPFKMAYDEAGLAEAMGSGFEPYELRNDLVNYNCGNASEKLLELMIDGKSGGLEILSWDKPNETTVIYAGDLEKEIHCRLTDHIINGLTDEEKANTVIAFENEIEKHTVEYLQKLDPSISFLRLAGTGTMSKKERAALHFNRTRGWCGGTAEEYFRREYRRLFGNVNCREIRFLNTDIFYRIGIMTAGSAATAIYRIPQEYYGKPNETFYPHPDRIGPFRGRFDREIQVDGLDLELWEGLKCDGIIARMDGLKISRSGGEDEISGELQISTGSRSDLQVEAFEISSSVYGNVFTYPMSFTETGRTSAGGVETRKGRFAVSVPEGEIESWYASNLMGIIMKVDGMDLNVQVMSKEKSRGSSNSVTRIPGSEQVCELKEDFRFARLMVRPENISDNPSEQRKLALAYALARITPWNKPVLLYEKNCARYEESASVLFERLVDSGRKDVRYILDRGYDHMDEIGQKYRAKLVDRYSFRHYYDMFAARTIISSESLDHCLEKKSGNGLFKKHILRGNKNYVFLQHGVMYMVSLDSEQRKFFRKSENGGKQRVVASSRLEAEHFTDNTNYDAGDIYVCGLLKFDRNEVSADADRIVVMTTWRPWEYVSGTGSLQDTGYYRMLRMIVDSVPEDLKDKLVVLPHPLIQDQVEGLGDDPVWKYYTPGMKYDTVLSRTRLFVTDYSSIAYDAFYRGASVVFFWKDKDECMKEYGKSAHLMLTEDLAFGDICMTEEELRASVRESYDNPPKQEYEDNYRKIVAFHDGKNTDRFIAMAKKDGIL